MRPESIAPPAPVSSAMVRRSFYASGWRPAIGWVCVAALALHYLLRPLLAWVAMAAGYPAPDLPGIDDNLWQLMLALLGIGGLRSFEKIKRVAA